MHNRIREIKEKISDSVFLSEMIKNNEEPQDEGNILNSLIRIVNAKVNPTIVTIQGILNEFISTTNTKIDQIGTKLELLDSNIEDVNDK